MPPVFKKMKQKKRDVSIIMSASNLLPINYILGEIEKFQQMQSYFLVILL